MKIYKISEGAQSGQTQLTPQQQQQQKDIQTAFTVIQETVATINRALNDLNSISVNQDATNIFKKNGLINLLQSGQIMGNVDQNTIKKSLTNTSIITNAVLVIHNQLEAIKASGGNPIKVIPIIVQEINTPNPQAFLNSMGNFISSLSAQTGETTKSLEMI